MHRIFAIVFTIVGSGVLHRSLRLCFVYRLLVSNFPFGEALHGWPHPCRLAVLFSHVGKRVRFSQGGELDTP